PSKMKYGEPVGIEALKQVKEKISVPIFGIGGIKRNTIREVMDSGAHGIALISGILGETDVRTSAEGYIKEMDKGEWR
ncbi:MAG TPA: thiamine phosphate synthase, partial [Dissulfurispiraceae bacterium]